MACPQIEQTGGIRYGTSRPLIGPAFDETLHAFNWSLIARKLPSDLNEMRVSLF